VSPKVPAALWLEALGAATVHGLSTELRGLTAGSHRLRRAKAPRFAATPRDFRPDDPEAGVALLAGRLTLAGATLELGPGGDPWDRPSPTRRFAVELHRFAFLPGLVACGEPGAREALRLFLDWRRLFWRPSAFAWGPEVLERRVFNLAVAARRMAGVASEVEGAELTGSLLHQAHLLAGGWGGVRRAERAVVAAVGAGALAGPAAEALLDRALARALRALQETVLADGGHRTRSPEAGLELLFDLLTLDDVLLQRGRETPPGLVTAMDRLGAAVRFHTLSDGRLAAFHGGAAAAAERVRAALNEDALDAPPAGQAPHSGYHRLDAKTLHIMLDTGAPATGRWSVTACAQPGAFELTAGADRLFANGGWSPDASGPQALRLTAAGVTLQVQDGSVGAPLTGFLARALGGRLLGGAQQVRVRREETEVGGWLEMNHDGWVRSVGLTHDRRLYLDHRIDEARGEEVLTPAPGRAGPSTPAPFCVRFHVFPGVEVSLARDGRSVMLRGPSGQGWWFRNDAPEVAIEPSVCFLDGQPHRTEQVVLRDAVGQEGARIRWKLSPIETPPKTKPKPAEDAVPEMLA
jgi:uncharacterized heparinase superfamily protein